MQLPRVTFVIEAVPIKDAISCVAVLLNFDQNVAATDSMKSTGWKKHRVTLLHAHRVDMLGARSGAQRFVEFSATDRFLKSDKQFSVRFGCGDVPTFRFRFAAKFGRDFFRRMNLQGKFFLRIKQFDQQWKARRARNIAEDFLSMLAPKFVQGMTRERSVGDNALRFGAVDDFP